MVKLSNAVMHRAYLIKSVGCDTRFASRLYDLGLREGAEVRCIGESPFGDPRTYRVRGISLALRRQDSEKIMCEEADLNDF